jgi:hypothetical protein
MTIATLNHAKVAKPVSVDTFVVTRTSLNGMLKSRLPLAAERISGGNVN